MTYIAEPVSKGWDAGEDGWFLHLVADARGHKAGHALDVPLTISTLTVQRTSRVPLQTEIRAWGGMGAGGGDKARDRKCFTNVGYYVIQVMVKVILLYYRRNMISRCFVASLTLHPDTSPPPAQIMVSFTTIPHQSLCLHTLFPTTGSRACCSLSGMGPWARTGQGGFS